MYGRNLGQFSSGGYIHPDGISTAVHMGPFTPFGHAFIVLQVPVVPGPVVYYPPTEEQKERMVATTPYWPLMSEMNH
jgi:hypothetical protein